MNMGRRFFFVCLWSMCLFIPIWTLPTPLLILKCPRSGSTWFTALLNRLEEIHITPEVIGWARRYDARVAEETNGKITSYVIESLQQPMLRWPEGEAFIRRKKRTLIVGSTLCPQTTSVDLGRITKSVPHLHVAALLRSNVVKHAISYIRAIELRKKCNKISQFVGGSCRLNEKTIIKIQQFHNFLIRVIADDLKIVKWAQELSGNLGNSFLVIWYEDMQETEDEVKNLIQWLGFDMKNFGRLKSYNGPCYVNCTKITSDDLRLVLANYEELESWIKSTYPCLSTQFYDKMPGRVQPSVSILCGELFTNETRAFHPN